MKSEILSFILNIRWSVFVYGMPLSASDIRFSEN